MRKKTKRLTWWLGVYFFLLIAFALWSYALVHPNLVLTSFVPYWQFQNWLWRTFYDHRWWLISAYALILGGLQITFWSLGRNLPAKNPWRRGRWWLLLLALPVLFSYNALSSDVFNYIFNAKMVLRYDLNPHLIQPWTVSDDWLRFMVNANGLAPYGYLWTGISLPLYLLGFDKFTLTYAIFKLASLGIFFAAAAYLARLDRSGRWWLILFISPLFLLEFISSGHNDLWMLLPAVASFFVAKPTDGKAKKLVALSLLIVSVLIKKMTLILLPFWAYYFFGAGLKCFLPEKIKSLVTKLEPYFFDAVSMGCFLPLFSEQAKQFYPWYLSWSLIWLPFLRCRWWRETLIIFSFAASWRYLPYLLTGEYNFATILAERLVLWTPAAIYVTLKLITYVQAQARRR